jgi:two-component system NtrC family response regulator
MANLAREYGRRVKRIDAGARVVMQQYPWPGNVRELPQRDRTVMIMVPGDSISTADLGLPRRGGLVASQAVSEPSASD